VSAIWGERAPSSSTFTLSLVPSTELILFVGEFPMFAVTSRPLALLLVLISALAGCVETGECVPADSISCGEIKTSSNAGPGHTDVIEDYSCTSWDESGPEYMYSFTPTTTGEVTALLTVSGDDNLDIFVLEASSSCDGNACVAFGASTAQWTAGADESYLIVVDGNEGGEGDFSLEILCP
jgi:disulfide bond formation protein DsbB